MTGVTHPHAAATHASLMAQPARLTLGVTLGLLASLAFAMSGTFARPLLAAGWTPGATVFWRIATASLLLLPVGCWVMRGQWRRVIAEWRLIGAFGVLGVATAQLMYFAAVARISVSVALLLEYLAPVALVLLAWARTRRVPSRLVIGGTLLALIGLVGVLDLTGAQLDPLGVLFGLLALVGAAGYFVLSARPSSLHPLALPAFGLPVGGLVLGAAILTGVLPYSAPLVDVELLGAAVAWWVPLSVVVIVATALAYSLGVAGIGLMGERLGSFISLSEVLFAAIVAALVLGEVPTAVQLVGGAAIVAGVVLIRLDNSRPVATAEPPELEPIDARN